jgi:hypothetical protein
MASPIGTTVPPSASIVRADNSAWTFDAVADSAGNFQVLRNSVPCPGGVGIGGNGRGVLLTLDSTGILLTAADGSLWRWKDAYFWERQSGQVVVPPPVVVPPVVVPPTSSNAATIAAINAKIAELQALVNRLV